MIDEYGWEEEEAGETQVKNQTYQYNNIITRDMYYVLCNLRFRGAGKLSIDENERHAQHERSHESVCPGAILPHHLIQSMQWGPRNL